MSEEIDLLKLVCERLNQAGVPYMITGSFAANFYAVPRMTRDLDIVIAIDHQDEKRLFEIFQNDFYVDQESIKEAIKHQGMFNIIHDQTVFKIDFIVRKDSSYRTTEFQRKQKLILGNSPIWIVSPEDLVISKLFWAKDSLSEMQLKDIKNILESVKNIDNDYIIQWVQNLDLEAIYKKAINYEWHIR